MTRSNQYGGTIGGPVRVPKVFNGKDKLFFFLAYEGFKDSSPGVYTRRVPTAAERTGDFSALLAAGTGFQLYDPTSAVLSAGKHHALCRSPATSFPPRASTRSPRTTCNTSRCRTSPAKPTAKTTTWCRTPP